MRGEVLHYDEGQGFGFITATDGARYTFTREDLRRQVPISRGTAVEFRQDGSQARDVFSIRAQYSAALPAAEAPAPQPQVGRTDPPTPATALPSTGVPRAATAPGSLPATGLFGYAIRALTTNYANFRDRARRKEYWGFVLFWTLALTVISITGALIDAGVGNFDNFGADAPVATIVLVVLFGVATFLPGLAVMIRRQHDIGLSGWFYLLFFVPYIGGLILFVFSLIPSQKHENRWGPVPYGVRI